MDFAGKNIFGSIIRNARLPDDLACHVTLQIRVRDVD
jgi:hypothetical protein